MVSSWTYALLFVCSQYATKTIAKEFITKKKKNRGEGKALSCKDKNHGKGQRQRWEIDGLVYFSTQRKLITKPSKENKESNSITHQNT